MLRSENYLLVFLHSFECYYGKTYLFTENISMRTDEPLI